ncbi:MAG: lysoplasmalogenase [Arenicella sp.]|jgi:uncharacterized membrane protein YhhN|nr:lysoplasmalogenase [Arenicella sp.]
MQAKVFLHNVLIVLVALLAISLAWFSIDPYYGYAKAAATLVIVAFFLRFARDLGGLNYVLGAVALVFCLVGDVALLFDNGFLAGLSSFLIGHLIFVWLFSRLAQGALSWFAVIFVFAIGAGYYIYISAGLATMGLPVAVYVSVISLMAAWGISLHKQLGSAASLLIMLGGFSFLISDGVLSYNRFISPDPLWHPVVLSTYWLSLALIVNGLAKIKAE